eukprot:5490967-Prymnesium_polylepis.1
MPKTRKQTAVRVARGGYGEVLVRDIHRLARVALRAARQIADDLRRPRDRTIRQSGNQAIRQSSNQAIGDRGATCGGECAVGGGARRAAAHAATCGDVRRRVCRKRGRKRGGATRDGGECAAGGGSFRGRPAHSQAT